MRSSAFLILLGSAGMYALQTPPTFNANSNLVEVTVVAHDGKDRPVAGLTHDDFEITDNRERREISSFSAVTEDRPGGTFTNTAGQAGPVVVLLDWINTSGKNEVWSRQRAVVALRALPPGQQAAVFVAQPGRLRMLHGFTTDHGELARSIDGHKEADDELRASGSDSTYDTSCGFHPGAAEADREMRERIRGALREFQFLAQELAPIRGRKTLIWVSGGFVLPRCATMSDEVDRTVRALNDANVGVYGVDARGLIGAAFSRRSIVIPDPLRNVFSMRTFTDRTGGQIYYNRNDIDAEMIRAAEDTRVSYTLGFYRAGDGSDSSSHKIVVRSLRRGVSVSYRESYTPKQPGAAWGILSDPLAVPLSVKAVRNAGVLDLTLHIDPVDITLVPKDDKWRGGGQIVSWFSQADGKPVSDTLFRGVAADLTEENRAKFLANGITYPMKLDVPERAVALHISLTDDGSGHVGNLALPLTEIPMR